MDIRLLSLFALPICCAVYADISDCANILWHPTSSGGEDTLLYPYLFGHTTMALPTPRVSYLQPITSFLRTDTLSKSARQGIHRDIFPLTRHYLINGSGVYFAQDSCSSSLSRQTQGLTSHLSSIGISTRRPRGLVSVKVCGREETSL